MADWRGISATNNKKSWVVVCVFFLMYIGMGLFFDLYLHAGGIGSIIFFSVAMITLLVVLFKCNSIALAGTKAKLITSDATDEDEKQLNNVVEEMKIAAGLSYMPKVYVLEVDYLNAFASGWREKFCCIAVSRPLLKLLSRAELQSVIAHELTHIRNQDTRLLVTVAVMANFLVFLIDVIFRGVLYSGRSRGRNNNWHIILVIMLIRIILPIVTALLILFLSRSREFMADAGAVELTRRNDALANALIKIHQGHQVDKKKTKEAYHHTAHEGMRSMSYIYNPKQAGIHSWFNVTEWFSTHPPLEKRLKALGLSKAEIKTKLSNKK